MAQLQLAYKLSWIEKHFIKSFPKRMSSLSEEEREANKQAFVDIYNRDAEFISDRQSQTHHIMCALVLAGHQTLIRKGLDQASAIEALTENMLGLGSGFVKWSMRLMLRLRLYTRKTVETKSFQTIQDRYGESFSLSEEKAENQYTMVISRCGYHDFFKRNKVPELTPIFCQWDTLWSEEINNNKSCGITFYRPITLGIDEKDCRFEFHFSKPK